MSGAVILFYILSAIVLTLAAASVFTRNIFRSAICLLASLMAIAGLYLLWDMEFVAALQIIIYVGGIVALIIFAIFLTHQAGKKITKQNTIKRIRAFILALLGFGFTVWIILSSEFHPIPVTNAETLSLHEIGTEILSYDRTGYLLPFEAVSFLLLAALVGSIVIAIKHKSKN